MTTTVDTHALIADLKALALENPFGSTVVDTQLLAKAAAALSVLLEERDEARKLAKHLFMMVDQETWRNTGGDDGQGHYEGDYRAEKIHNEILAWDREQTKHQQASLTLEDYGDRYRLRSLLLRIAESGGRFLSAQDQSDAKMYADRLETINGNENQIEVAKETCTKCGRDLHGYRGSQCRYCDGTAE